MIWEVHSGAGGLPCPRHRVEHLGCHAACHLLPCERGDKEAIHVEESPCELPPRKTAQSPQPVGDRHPDPSIPSRPGSGPTISIGAGPNPTVPRTAASCNRGAAVRWAPCSVRLWKVVTPYNRGMPRILVIDDDRDIRYLVRTWLETRGYEVEEAGDGAEGLSIAARTQPSVIVCDVIMPRLDGYEVLARLKEGPATRDIPVVMLSARGQEEGVIRALELGAADYVVKPFSPRELVVRVDRLAKGEATRGVEVLRRKLRLIERFARTARRLVEMNDVGEICCYVLDEALSATEAERGSVLLAEGGFLTIAASRGIDQELARTIQARVGEGISGKVAESGRPFLVQNIHELPEGLAANPERYPGGSLLSVPIRLGDESVAVLNVNTKAENDMFSADDLEALEILGELTALALARLLPRSGSPM
jgi:DNA-binding response OmpR family regulator